MPSLCSHKADMRNAEMRAAIGAGLSAPAHLMEQLRPTSTARERVQGLVYVFEIHFLAKILMVSSTAVRKWLNGTEPGTDLAMTIDDLRSVAVIFLEAGFEPARIRSWFLSRDPKSLGGKRPVACLARSPAKVLGAAREAVKSHAASQR